MGWQHDCWPGTGKPAGLGWAAGACAAAAAAHDAAGVCLRAHHGCMGTTRHRHSHLHISLELVFKFLQHIARQRGWQRRVGGFAGSGLQLGRLGQRDHRGIARRVCCTGAYANSPLFCDCMRTQSCRLVEAGKGGTLGGGHPGAAKRKRLPGVRTPKVSGMSAGLGGRWGDDALRSPGARARCGEGAPSWRAGGAFTARGVR